MCALVTGVQTCALPISELGQDAERVADPHVPGPAARHLPRPRHHGDGARPEPAGRRPARFAGPAPQAPRLGRATMSLLSVRGLSVSLATQDGPLAILQDVPFAPAARRSLGPARASGSAPSRPALPVIGPRPGPPR